MNIPALDGVTVLIGRPAGMEGSWRRGFETLGATVIHQPGLDIHPCEPTPAVIKTLAHLGPADCAVFSSRPGVEHALALAGLKERLQSCTCWAVGRQSARSLIQAGLPRVRSPAHGYGADALLADPDFPDAKHAFLFGAEGGRTVIQRTLTDRGIGCTPVMVYTRSPAAPDAAAASALSRFGPASPVPLLVIGSSVAVLERLTALFPQALDGAMLVSLGPRVTRAARQYRFSMVVSAQRPDLASVLEAAKLAVQRRPA